MGKVGKFFLSFLPHLPHLSMHAWRAKQYKNFNRHCTEKNMRFLHRSLDWMHIISFLSMGEFYKGSLDVAMKKADLMRQQIASHTGFGSTKLLQADREQALSTAIARLRKLK